MTFHAAAELIDKVEPAPAGPQDLADPDEVSRVRSMIRLDVPATIENLGDQVMASLVETTDEVLRELSACPSPEITDGLTGLLQNVKQLSPMTIIPMAWFYYFLGKEQQRLAGLRTRFQRTTRTLDPLVPALQTELERHRQARMALVKHEHVIRSQLSSLDAHIQAGEKRLAECEAILLPKLEHDARKESGDKARQMQHRHRALGEAASLVTRKVGVLRQARVTTARSLLPIQHLQTRQATMIEMAEAMLTQHIPAWRSQMAIALALHKRDDDTALEICDPDAATEVNQTFRGQLGELLIKQQQHQHDQTRTEQILRQIQAGLAEGAERALPTIA